MVRYNKVIELLEQGKPVFCSGLVWNGSLDDLAFVADSEYDMTIIEMEHRDFSFDKLRMSLQFLLSRKRIAEGGSLQADPVPLVRVPPNVRERNQWVLKQALDTGVYGLVLPHLNTVEDAQAAVVAARYPQVPGSADFEPQGERGWWSRGRAALLGPGAGKVLRRGGPLAAGPGRKYAPDGDCRGAPRRRKLEGYPAGGEGHRSNLGRPGRYVGGYGAPGEWRAPGRAGQPAPHLGDVQGCGSAMRHRGHRGRGADAPGAGVQHHHHLTGDDDAGAGRGPAAGWAVRPRLLAGFLT